MSRLVLAALLAAMVVIGAVLVGEMDGSNYAAERTQQMQVQEAERTARIAITEAERTERTAISANLSQWQMAQEAQTMRLFLLVVFGSVVLVVVSGVVVYVVRATAYNPPRQVAMLAQRLPGYQPSVIDGQWVLESEQDYLTVDSARKLLKLPIDK